MLLQCWVWIPLDSLNLMLAWPVSQDQRGAGVVAFERERGRSTETADIRPRGVGCPLRLPLSACLMVLLTPPAYSYESKHKQGGHLVLREGNFPVVTSLASQCTLRCSSH